MNETINNFHTLIRRYCMDEIYTLKKDQIIEQRKNLNIYEETKDMTENQVNQCIYEKSVSLSLEDWIELEHNIDLHRNKCAMVISISIDILNVILKGIEKIEPEKYKTLNDMKNTVSDVVNASKISEIRHYSGFNKEDKETVCENMKQELIHYINTINEAHLSDVTPLFYRRVLTEKKISELCIKLRKQWLDKAVPFSTLATHEIVSFKTNYFLKTVDQDKLIRFLKNNGEERIYEINTCEVDPASYIMDTTALVIRGMSEAYWFSDKMDWALIRDHEDFYYICGENFVSEFNAGNFSLIKME